MEIGLSIPINMDPEEQINYALSAESKGIDHIWVGDNPPLNNAFLTIQQLLDKTSTISLWTGITSPFYYTSEVLVSIIQRLSFQYEGRFGLALGIGNLNTISSLKGIKSPFSSFKKKTSQFRNLYERRKEEGNQELFPNFPFAVGALGEKMCKYAIDRADILLLNSSSSYDINRVYSILEENKSENHCKIFPYAMFQILDENDEISLTTWNIVKDIAKTCSDEILISHGYPSSFIQEIRNLPWNRMSNLPKNNFLSLIEDFAIVGTIEEVLEKMDIMKQFLEEGKIEGLVFGWMYKENQWNYIRELRKMF